MKKLIIEIILYIFLAILPSMPIYFIEPIYIGTDNNIYPYWTNIYIACFIMFLYTCWIILVHKIVKWLTKDIPEN